MLTKVYAQKNDSTNEISIGNVVTQRASLSTTKPSDLAQIISHAKMNPASLTRADAMYLQRTIGNQAVIKLLSSIENAKNNPNPIQQKKDIEANTVHTESIQKKENNTGLPNRLKSGVEKLSGLSMDDVRVHYNSDKPAGLGALAYTQGTDIHVAPGQEKQLPHEAWHVVQQAQGRVRPTMQMKGQMPVNDDECLEKEADLVGRKVQVLSENQTTTKFGINKNNGFLKNSDLENETGLIQNQQNHQMSINKQIIQRVIIQGPDADEGTEFASLGYSRLISQSEIQNTNKYLQDEKRNGEKPIIRISELEEGKIEYDSVNYINGHYEPSKGKYLGYSPKEMADLLKKSGLRSDKNIILLGCESRYFAEDLVKQLRENEILVKVTGATGIAFDYKNDNGQIIEAMYDPKKIPSKINEKHNKENKLRVAHKHEQLFINKITSKIMEDDIVEDKKKFIEAFPKITHISYKPRIDLPPEREEELRDLQLRINERLQSAQAKREDEEVIQATNEFIEEAINLYKNGEKSDFCKEQLIEFSKYIAKKLPRLQKIKKKPDDFEKQAKENGTFVLDTYTSSDQLWISTFMKEIKKWEDSPLKKNILDTYIDQGREAANEYIKTMCEGYNAEAKDAIIEKGWITFSHDDKTKETKTFRDAADGVSSECSIF